MDRLELAFFREGIGDVCELGRRALASKGLAGSCIGWGSLVSFTAAVIDCRRAVVRRSGCSSGHPLATDGPVS